jgi:hypothetical protein
MSMSKCLSSVQEYAYKVFEASLKGLNEAKRAIADHLKNESLDGEVEWNPIGRAVTAMYCLLGIVSGFSVCLNSELIGFVLFVDCGSSKILAICLPPEKRG